MGPENRKTKNATLRKIGEGWGARLPEVYSAQSSPTPSLISYTILFTITFPLERRREAMPVRETECVCVSPPLGEGLDQAIDYSVSGNVTGRLSDVRMLKREAQTRAGVSARRGIPIRGSENVCTAAPKV